MSSWNFNNNTHPSLPNGQSDYFNAIEADVSLPNGLTAGWWLIRRCDMRFNQQVCVVTMDGYLDSSAYETYVRDNGYPPEPLHTLEATFSDTVYNQAFRAVEQSLMSVLTQTAADECEAFTTHEIMNGLVEGAGGKMWDPINKQPLSSFATDFGWGSRQVDGTTDVYGVAWPTISGAVASIQELDTYDTANSTKYAETSPYYTTAKSKGTIK